MCLQAAAPEPDSALIAVYLAPTRPPGSEATPRGVLDSCRLYHVCGVKDLGVTGGMLAMW